MVFHEPTPKNQIFQWTPIILNFSCLTPPHNIKVTKFLLKSSQFKFLVMTRKNIFVQQPPSKNWDPVKPPLFENLVGGSTPPAKIRSAHYANIIQEFHTYDKSIYFRLSFESHCFHDHAWNNIKCSSYILFLVKYKTCNIIMKTEQRIAVYAQWDRWTYDMIKHHMITTNVISI